ncbi:DNA polymerase epsilon subunit 4 [Wyeomyia smithii]|uniref:DNA polymerase epsilon subunit 4 n=1 Tax=Wyeomyia smithii TaxID=174621 RepID=UPI002467CAD5|nr:DNA polymerase epsilon subunit 4 [Wyeomyia smithii]
MEAIVNRSITFESEEIDFGTEELSEQDEILLNNEGSTVVSDKNISSNDGNNEASHGDGLTPAQKESSDEPTRNNVHEHKEPRLVNFPLSKVKQIMKFDPEVHIISAEAVFLTTRAAEFFVQTLIKEAYSHATAAKKKTINKRDVESTIESVDTLMFLEGMMNT